MKKKQITFTLLLSVVCAITTIAQTANNQHQTGTASMPVMIDNRDKGRTYDGIGALSAGASSRLLIDYPEPQRSEILDYLFKPNFGAALQINKVEIGGDMNSTDGSEPSHMMTPFDHNYQRGYEWWLMVESKKRNPAIKLYALEWGAPNWVNPTGKDVWTPENIAFIIDWVRHAKSDYGLKIDYLGGWNEKSFNKEWYKQFRDELNKEGFSNIQVVADDSFKWNVGHEAKGDTDFAASFEIIGMHYPDLNSSTKLAWKESLATGKTLWGSEIGSKRYDSGASGLAKIYNQGYVDSKMTAFINWATIWSVLPGLPHTGEGLMLADQPWSRSYTVGPSIWVTAHTTQFAKPGWHYLDGACGFLGGDSKNGSFVTLASPNSKDFSLVVETVDANIPQKTTFRIKGFTSIAPLHLWRTDLRSERKDADWFVKMQDITLVKGSFTLTLDPGCIYTVTTTTGQHKGMTTIPPRAPLPLPFKDDFQSYELGKTPRYFSDQHGTFEVAPAGGGRHGKCFRQMITAKPICWNRDADPGSVVGDPSWKDYCVSSDVLLEQSGYVDLIGRDMEERTQNVIRGYHLRLTDSGHWSLVSRTLGTKEQQKKKMGPQEIELASGNIPETTSGVWHSLTMTFVGNTITATIDGKVVVDQIKDSTYQSGLVGIQVSRWQNAQFMNFEVKPIPPISLGSGKDHK